MKYDQGRLSLPWSLNKLVPNWSAQSLGQNRDKFVCFLFSFLKFFWGATGTPVLDFWWRLLWVSKSEWDLPYLLFCRGKCNVHSLQRCQEAISQLVWLKPNNRLVLSLSKIVKACGLKPLKLTKDKGVKLQFTCSQPINWKPQLTDMINGIWEATALLTEKP